MSTHRCTVHYTFNCTRLRSTARASDDGNVRPLHTQARGPAKVLKCIDATRRTCSPTKHITRNTIYSGDNMLRSRLNIQHHIQRRAAVLLCVLRTDTDNTKQISDHVVERGLVFAHYMCVLFVCHHTRCCCARLCAVQITNRARVGRSVFWRASSQSARARPTRSIKPELCCNIAYSGELWRASALFTRIYACDFA